MSRWKSSPPGRCRAADRVAARRGRSGDGASAPVCARTARPPARHPTAGLSPVAQAIGLPLELRPGMKPTQLPLLSARAADRAAALPERPAPQVAAYVLAERIGRLLREPVDVH